MPEQSLQVSIEQAIYFFTVALIAIGLLAGFFFVVIISYFRANARRQSELIKAMIETQEEERSRIAIDMHDDLGPLLSAVKLQVGSLKSSVSGLAGNTLEQTQNLLDDAIVQIRQIIRDLVPKNIDKKGILGVLNDLKTQVESFSPIRIHLDSNQQDERFSIQAETNVFRLIQELINNSVKHAMPENIYVKLEMDDTYLKIHYRDDGRGFDPQKAGEGSGLKNIQTRVQMSRGQYRLQAAEGSGTQYFFTFEKRFLH